MNRRVLLTGASGFIGSNLKVAIDRADGYECLAFDKQQSQEDLVALGNQADIVVHFAGVNRPREQGEFEECHVGLTASILKILAGREKQIPLILSSSIQSGLSSAYGRSKLAAEGLVADYCSDGGRATVFRFPNVFGKWCHPNYNSVVATFCHNLAHDIPIEINDPRARLELLYIDDLVGDVLEEIIALLDAGPRRDELFRKVTDTYSVTVQDLAERLEEIRECARSVRLPELSDPLVKKLHATYLSYLPSDARVLSMNIRADQRGELFEFIKSTGAGQVFVSRTKPGVTRGNHYHDTKNEKFCVIAGEAEITVRRVGDERVLRYPVRGDCPETVVIAPGFTHAIKNVGRCDLITLFWASEPFDPQAGDTYFEQVE